MIKSIFLSHLILLGLINLQAQTTWSDTTIEYCTKAIDPLTLEWVPSQKDVYTFDKNGNQIEREEFISIPFSNAWDPVTKFTKSFDSLDRVVKSVHYISDVLTLTYYIDSKFEWTYDSTKQSQDFILRKYFSYDPFDLVYQLEKTDSIIYDSNDQKIEEYVRRRGSFDKTVFTYNPAGDMYLSYDLSWTTNQWDSTGKRIITYDSNRQPIEDVSLAYDPNGTSVKWLPSRKYTFVYDNNGNNTEKYTFIGNGLNWDDFYKDFYTYDVSKNIIEEANYKPDGSTSNLYLYKKYFSNYNAASQRTKLIEEHWNSSGSRDGRFKTTYAFDSNGNQIQHYDYDWIESKMIWDIRNKGGLCDLLLSIEKENWEGIKAYPNPTSSYIILEKLPIGSRITVFNPLGQIVHQKSPTTSDQESINLANWGSKGIFLITVKKDAFQAFVKVILH